MILAVDPAYATCGWAMVDSRTAAVRALGVITTSKERGVPLAVDRARRSCVVAARLAELATSYAVFDLAAEDPLGFGAASAIAAQQLPWGALIMLAATRNYSLRGIGAKVWQRAVLGDDVKKVNYDQVETALACHVSAEAGDALQALTAIDKKLRNHALDAVGVGVTVAMRPGESTLIRAARGPV